MKEEFLKKGFSKLPCLIPFSEVAYLKGIYDGILNDKQRTLGLRSDLGGQEDDEDKVEKITQIMRPSWVEPKFIERTVYKLALDYAKKIFGKDMELDFDMLINKAPFTNTPTPWHQDAAYWIKLPDKRSVSCWIALDDVFEDNGCMWFIPKKEGKILPHKLSTKGGALQCEADINKAQSVPLKAGGCTFHDGFTLHFSGGNITHFQRRALILNFRPKAMIEMEREQGIDHTGERKVRNK